jgi:hypothetical protein
MKMNNNDGQHNKTVTFPRKSIVKATVFIVVLFISAAILDLLGYLDFNAFAGLKLTTKTKEPNPYGCDFVQNQSSQTPISQNRKSRLNPNNSSKSSTCPSYFRWIHEDLRPWKQTGITRGMIEEASRTAHFRLVIRNGKAYVKRYKKSIQTRDEFTLWGILQLLRWYPGKLPDLELMFDADDRPVVRSVDFIGQQKEPPPVFRYCSDDASLDIVFPDWSFWGW